MQLRQFYRDYYKWYKAGAQSSDVFFPELGLCSNLARWVKRNTVGVCWLTESLRLQRRIKRQFQDAGLDRIYPFGSDEYDIYPGVSDPNRIAWVRKHLR